MGIQSGENHHTCRSWCIVSFGCNLPRKCLWSNLSTHSDTRETWSYIKSIRFHPNTSSWLNLWMSHHLFQWLQSFKASNPAPIECCGINFLHLNIIGPFREISCQIEEGLIVKWGGFKNSWSNCHNFASNAFLLVNFDAIQSHGALPEAPALHKLSLDSSWSLLTLGPSMAHKRPGLLVRPSSRQTWDLIIIRCGTVIGN